MAKVSVGLNPCCSGQWSRTTAEDALRIASKLS